MRYSSILLAVMASFVSAQNPFTMDTIGTLPVGTPYNITWYPSTGAGTVTLILRRGNSSALDTVETIASSIPNSGSYVWTPESTLVSASDYAFEIVDDSDADKSNYSEEFAIVSSNTVSAAYPSGTAAGSSLAIVSTTKGLWSNSTISATSFTAVAITLTSAAVATAEASSEEASVPSKTVVPAIKTSGSSSATSASSLSEATQNAASSVKARGAILGFLAAALAVL